MSIKLITNENDLFVSQEIRTAFINNIKKYTSVSIVKACAAVGVNYDSFFKSYLNSIHPDKTEVSEILSITQFKNILKLFGLELRHTLYLHPDFNADEANQIIRERTSRSRNTSVKKT